MKYQTHSMVLLLWGFVSISAVITRLLFISQVPIDTTEAHFALGILTGESNFSFFLNNPIQYSMIKGLTFLVGNEIFAFRIIQALCGIAIVVSPWFLRKYFGEVTALILAFFALLDPFLVLNSRFVYGNAFTIVVVILIAYSFINKRSTMIGFSIGVGIFCGWTFFRVVILACLSIITYFIILKNEANNFSRIKRYVNLISLRDLFSGMAPVLLGFVLFSAATGTFPISVLTAGFNPTPTPAKKSLFLFGLNQKFLIFITYATIPWVIGLIMGFKNRHESRLIYKFLMVSQLLFTFAIIFIPLFNLTDFVWIFIPAYINLALYGKRNFGPINAQLDRRTFVVFAVVLVIMGFILLNLSRFLSVIWNINLVWNIIAGVFLAFVILALAIITYSKLWNTSIVLPGLAWGILTICIILQTAFIMRVSGLSSKPGHDIMRIGDVCEGIPEIHKFVHNIKNKYAINTDIDSIRVVGDYPCESFAFAQMRIPISPIKSSTAAIIISSNIIDENIISQYRGIKIRSTSYPIWRDQGIKALLSIEFWKWVIQGKSKLNTSNVYLWINKQHGF